MNVTQIMQLEDRSLRRVGDTSVPARAMISEHLDDRSADDLTFERTGHIVIVLPSTEFAGPECEGSLFYQ